MKLIAFICNSDVALVIVYGCDHNSGCGHMMSALIGVCVHYFKYCLKTVFPHSRHPLLVDRTPYGLPVPVIKHKVVTEDELRGRRMLIVGDVHGCYDELVELIDTCNARDPNICLVFVGDLVNKGPKSDQVVKLVRELQGYCVRGNHDEVALSAWQQDQDREKSLSSQFKWFNKLSHDDIDWLLDLSFTIHFPSRGILVTHAGLVPGVDIDLQILDNLLHLRDVTFDAKSLTFSGHKNVRSDGQPWAQAWQGPDHVYFGHDARRFFQSYPYATGLDTGCVYGGSLTAVFPDDNKIVQVKAHNTYRKPDTPNPILQTAPAKL